MNLDGFAISGYRSFGPNLVYIKDLKKINIFIGKNNSGKSNILRFCKHLSEMKFRQQYKDFDPALDYCVNLPDKDIKFAIQMRKNSSVTGTIYNQIEAMLPWFEERFPEWKDSIWLSFSLRNLGVDWDRQLAISELGNLIKDRYDDRTTNDLARQHLSYTGGTHEGRSRDLAKVIVGWVNLSFKVYIIEAFRQITPEIDENSLSGRGLIKRLREIQSPELIQYQESKEKFAKINTFVRNLLGEDDAYLEIPAKLDDVYVSIKGKILPLHSLGTGIHELIILAAAVTIIDDAIFCIEEPEIHLHPELQKKFIHYIKQNTNNQYLITTHSNAFFDMDGVNIYFCRLIDQHTTCELINTDSDSEKHTILSDLGYKASDILQSNFIIWVEGPSDRIYLNHWIRGKDPSLIEGLHYSIMFYGGRLLSHLAFDSPEVNEFIQLCKLNRNAAIVIDSDKRSQYQKINSTKQRIMNDFQQNNCLVWLTKGKEIENYVNEELFNNAVSFVHPSIKKRIKWDRFSNMTTYGKARPIDKVAVARGVELHPSDYSVLDLDKQISQLIKHIKTANL